MPKRKAKISQGTRASSRVPTSRKVPRIDEVSAAAGGSKEAPVKKKKIETTFLTLNSDCHWMIMSYLDKIDLAMLRLAIPRIQELHEERFASPWDHGITIDQQFRERNPVSTCAAVYKEIGASGLHLALGIQYSDQDIPQLLSYIPNTKFLGLNLRGGTVNMLDSRVINQFPALEGLNIVSFNPNECFLHMLMTHLGPTLRELTYVAPGSLTPLLHLRKLTSLRFDFSGEPHVLEQILDQNTDIQSVTVNCIFRNYYNGCNWEVLAETRHLECLNLESLSEAFPPIPEALQFKYLFELQVQLGPVTTMQYLSEILSHMGPQLQHIILSGEVDMIEPMDICESVCAFEGLLTFSVENEQDRTRIELSGDERAALLEDWRTVVMQIITQYPRLKEMRIPFLIDDTRYRRELAIHLKANRRVLEFNDEALPAVGEE